MANKPDYSQLFNIAEKMQQNMQDLHKSLAAKKVTGSAGAGDVKVDVIMNGQQIVEKVIIAQGAMNEGKEILADLAAAAFNNAMDKVKTLTKDAMLEVYQKSGIPFDQGDKQ